MTLFEYLSVATSIVLSMSVAQLIMNLRSVLNSQRRYWVHTLWVFLLIFGHLVIWWEFWGYREVGSWNLARFTLMLLNPGILLFCSNALVQIEGVESPDWKDHFYKVRASFFAAFGMLPVISVLRRWELADLPISSIENSPEALFATLCLSGFLLKQSRAHEPLVLIYWIAILVTSARSWFEPGAVVG